MIVSIPREIKDHEFRVSATPGAYDGKVTYPAMAEAFGLPHTALENG